MKTIGVLCLVSVLAFGAGDEAVPPGPSKTSVPNSNHTSTSTQQPTSSSSTTLSPTTTTSTTTTTTSKPTLPTSSPTTSTTTTTTTTKPPTTTTTTTKPPTTTTTTKPPTPTTIPPNPTTAKPIEPIGTWFVNYTGTNRTCLVLQGNFTVELPFKVNNTNKLISVAIPSNASVDGSCLNTTENLKLSFNETNTVTFFFNKTKDNKFNVGLIVVTLNVTYPGDKNYSIVVLTHNGSDFSTPTTSSYKCLKEQTLNLVSLPKLDNGGLLRVSHLQLQAFRNASNTKFDEALDCASSETPDVVPIAVGCALAALVIIVLVAYLIGRRRSQARGYLSM